MPSAWVYQDDKQVKKHGADKASAYQTVLQIMAGLLVAGFIANLLVRAVAEKSWMAEKEVLAMKG